MCVINYPMEILTPVRQRFVDIVHGLCQRCKALGHLFQPGGRCTVLLRLGLPCLRLFFRLRHKPRCGHGRYGRDADADVQQILERAPGRLHTECTGHAAARVGSYRFHAPSGCQHCRCHRGTGKAGCRKAEGRVCRAQRSAQHRAGRKRGFGLPFAA